MFICPFSYPTYTTKHDIENNSSSNSGKENWNLSFSHGKLNPFVYRNISCCIIGIYTYIENDTLSVLFVLSLIIKFRKYGVIH